MAGWAEVEVKNKREWTYPNNPDIRELLTKVLAISVNAEPNAEAERVALSRSQVRITRAAISINSDSSDMCARDLATFVRALSSNGCRIAVLGQESALRALSPLERDERLNSSATRLWRCILAMRLRDATMGGELIAIATDSAQRWWLRGAAIWAAGRLPYAAALEQMVPLIMAERSPLTIDGNSSLHCHSVMSSILLVKRMHHYNEERLQ